MRKEEVTIGKRNYLVKNNRKERKYGREKNKKLNVQLSEKLRVLHRENSCLLNFSLIGSANKQESKWKGHEARGGSGQKKIRSRGIIILLIEE